MKQGIIRNQEGVMIVAVSDAYRFISEMDHDIKPVGEVKLSDGKYFKYNVVTDLSFSPHRLIKVYIWKGYNLYIKI